MAHERWADRAVREWLVCGPFPAFGKRRPPTDRGKWEAGLRQAIATDFLSEHGAENGIAPTSGMTHTSATGTCQWRPFGCDTDLLDLAALYPRQSHSVAYAWTELHMADTGPTLLAIGSEARYQNSVQLWIDGQRVYDRWVLRRTRDGDDLVLVDVRPGVTTVLIKITGVHAGWGFTFRVVGPQTAPQALLNAACRGQVSTVEYLLDMNTPIAAADRMGETPLHQTARHDQCDVASVLLARGAAADAQTPCGLSSYHLAERKGSRSWLARLSQTGFAADTRRPDQRKQVDALFSAIDKDGPGAAVVVGRDGEIVYARGFGCATHLHEPGPITIRTPFPIASTSKSFLAAAIWRLHEQDVLDAMAPISDYLEAYPRGDDITLYQLLTHTSGVRQERPTRASLDYEPGTGWAYTDMGYVLLGHIIRRVTGASYRSYLRDQLFQPLELQATKSVGSPGGGVESSAEDVFLFYDALGGGRILNAETLESAFAPARLADGTLVETGWPWASHCTAGWHIATVAGCREIAHRGNFAPGQTDHANGFCAYAAAYPERRLAVVVLQNSDPPQVLAQLQPHQPVAEIDASVLAKEIAEIYLKG